MYGLRHYDRLRRPQALSIHPRTSRTGEISLFCPPATRPQSLPSTDWRRAESNQSARSDTRHVEDLDTGPGRPPRRVRSRVSPERSALAHVRAMMGTLGHRAKCAERPHRSGTACLRESTDGRAHELRGRASLHPVHGRAMALVEHAALDGRAIVAHSGVCNPLSTTRLMPNLPWDLRAGSRPARHHDVTGPGGSNETSTHATQAACLPHASNSSAQARASRAERPKTIPRPVLGPITHHISLKTGCGRSRLDPSGHRASPEPPSWSGRQLTHAERTTSSVNFARRRPSTHDYLGARCT